MARKNYRGKGGLRSTVYSWEFEAESGEEERKVKTRTLENHKGAAPGNATVHAIMCAPQT